MADETFIDRHIYIGEPEKRFCDECGAEGEALWTDVTTFSDPTGVHRFYPSGRYRCPNGPHIERRQHG